MSKNKICPFLNKPCIKDECAIWDPNLKACSIRTLVWDIKLTEEEKKSIRDFAMQGIFEKMKKDIESIKVDKNMNRKIIEALTRRK